MHEFERKLVAMFWEHFMSDLINSKIHNWTGDLENSQVPEEIQFHLHLPKSCFLFRRSAFEKVNFVDAKFDLFQNSEFFGFETFISDGFISSRKCPILMVDPALNSLDSELFNARFDDFAAFFPADLSRKKLGDPLSSFFYWDQWERKLWKRRTVR